VGSKIVEIFGDVKLGAEGGTGTAVERLKAFIEGFGLKTTVGFVYVGAVALKLTVVIEVIGATGISEVILKFEIVGASLKLTIGLTYVGAVPVTVTLDTDVVGTTGTAAVILRSLIVGSVDNARTGFI
tara:strand:+ start:100 stop:483 length:384 start_codon:yes stop_codon:yes gene_type:complete